MWGYCVQPSALATVFIAGSKRSVFSTGVPLLTAFAQLFLQPVVRKVSAGLSESKHQLINCWSQIRSCVVSSDPCKGTQKIAFPRTFVAHSPSSSGQSRLLMGGFNCWPAEMRTDVRVKCVSSLDNIRLHHATLS